MDKSVLSTVTYTLPNKAVRMRAYELLALFIAPIFADPRRAPNKLTVPV